jgi:hypothetical protein
MWDILLMMFSLLIKHSQTNFFSLSADYALPFTILLLSKLRRIFRTSSDEPPAMTHTLWRSPLV